MNKRLCSEQPKPELSSRGPYWKLADTRTAKASAARSPSYPDDRHQVAVTTSGACYHHVECRCVAYSAPSPMRGQCFAATVRIVTLGAARAHNYKPCQYCWNAHYGAIMSPSRLRQAPRQAPAQQEEPDSPIGRGPDTPPPIFDGEDTPSTGGEITSDEAPDDLDSDDSNYSCQRHRPDCPGDVEAKRTGTTRYGLQPGRMYLDADKNAARRAHNLRYHRQ